MRREYAVPCIQSIGVFLSDMNTCGVLQHCAMPLPAREIRRIDVVRAREWIELDVTIRFVFLGFGVCPLAAA